MSPIEHAESFLAGQPTPAAIAWVRSSLASLIGSDFTTVSKAFGIDQTFPARYRHRQWLKHLGDAVALVRSEHSTAYSIAKVISAEIIRQRRFSRPRHPVSEFEQHIADALAINPDGADSPDALRKHISKILESIPRS